MKGLVVDVKGSRAVILKDDGTFANVKNKNYKIGQKVKSSSAVMRSIRIAACIALCIIASATSYKFYYTPYSYLYIDINPSVRLDLNYFDIVIKCTPLNGDAEFIEVASGNVEDSINEIITKCEEKGFLTEANNEIEINVSENNNKVKNTVSGVENKYKNTHYKVVIKDATKKETAKANEHGISVKRQRAIEEFSTVFGGNEKENTAKLQDKTTKEINALISNKNKEEYKPEVKEPEKETVPAETAQPQKPMKTPNKTAPTKQDTAAVVKPPQNEAEDAPPVEKPKEEPPKQDVFKQDIPEPNVSEQERPEHEKPEQERPEQEKPEQERPEQEKPEQERPEQEKPEQDAPVVVPEEMEKPNVDGEITPPHIPESGDHNPPTEKPTEEERQPHEEVQDESVKEPEAEPAPTEKKPLKNPAGGNEHQTPPPDKGGKMPNASTPTKSLKF